MLFSFCNNLWDLENVFFLMNSEKRNILNRANLFWLHSWIDQFQASSQVLPPNSPFPPFQIYIEMPNPTAAFDGQMTSPPPKNKNSPKKQWFKNSEKKTMLYWTLAPLMGFSLATIILQCENLSCKTSLATECHTSRIIEFNSIPERL